MGQSYKHKTTCVLLKLPSMWTRSYFVSTAGNVSSETIRKYIEEQAKQDWCPTRSENSRSASPILLTNWHWLQENSIPKWSSSFGEPFGRKASGCRLIHWWRYSNPITFIRKLHRQRFSLFVPPSSRGGCDGKPTPTPGHQKDAGSFLRWFGRGNPFVFEMGNWSCQMEKATNLW